MESVENFLERAGGSVRGSGAQLSVSGGERPSTLSTFAKSLISSTVYLLSYPQSFPEHCLGVSLQGVPAAKSGISSGEEPLGPPLNVSEALASFCVQELICYL